MCLRGCSCNTASSQDGEESELHIDGILMEKCLLRCPVACKEKIYR